MEPTPSSGTCSALFAIGHPDASGKCASLSLAVVATLFGASLRAIGTALSIAAVGFALARSGNMDAKGKALLSFLSMNCTIPCLLFTQSAAAIRPAVLAG